MMENGCSAGLGKLKKVMREMERVMYTTESCMGKIMMPLLHKYAMCNGTLCMVKTLK